MSGTESPFQIVRISTPATKPFNVTASKFRSSPEATVELGYGANAGTSSVNTLISFDPDTAEAIGKDLIAAAATARQLTASAISLN
jgi:hypothetical protein